jgi:hypothetical protein
MAVAVVFESTAIDRLGAILGSWKPRRQLKSNINLADEISAGAIPTPISLKTLRSPLAATNGPAGRAGRERCAASSPPLSGRPPFNPTGR